MRYLVPLIGSLVIVSLCQPVPITGRRQLSLIPDSQLMELSFNQYRQFLTANKVVTGTENSELVKKVGNNITAVVECYFRDKPKTLEGYRWEFNLIEDTLVNAWAMPGGKVAVYTGILPVTKNDTGLAVVMSHEIAHAIAEHGNERMSQLLLLQLGGMALQQALANAPAMTNQLALAAFGVGTQVGILLPYSRLQENEADRLGLIFMAMAGYDPRAAVNFWKRMMESQQSPRPPEFLSTHPSDESRIKNIQELIPEAMNYHKTDGRKNRCSQ